MRMRVLVMRGLLLWMIRGEVWGIVTSFVDCYKLRDVGSALEVVAFGEGEVSLQKACYRSEADTPRRTNYYLLPPSQTFPIQVNTIPPSIPFPLPLPLPSTNLTPTPNPPNPRSSATAFQRNCLTPPPSVTNTNPKGHRLLLNAPLTPLVASLLATNNPNTPSPCHPAGAPAYAPSSSRIMAGVGVVDLHWARTFISRGGALVPVCSLTVAEGRCQCPTRSMPKSFARPVRWRVKFRRARAVMVVYS